MRRTMAAGLLALGLAATAASAQSRKPRSQPAPPAQKVVPPDTVYWMTAVTQSGFGLAGTPDTRQLMRLASGRGGGVVRTLALDLGSRRLPQGRPEAAHAIPPAMRMGASLPLVTPKRDRPPPPAGPVSEPEDFERPKGRLLLFWGCGETARPGQPVVIDFTKVAEGQIPPNLFVGERVRIARPPSPDRWPTTGHWPNETREGRREIPAGASLVGAHRVTGTYIPDIAFELTQDWMAPLDLRQTRLPTGALRLDWNAVPGTTGHFAQLVGGSGSGREDLTMVYWSSSEVQTFFSALGDHVAPAEAARQVARRTLLPPAQTTCTVPKEAIVATQGGLVSVVAHGPEVNIIHPPRPEDPRIPWVQEWAVKVRFAGRAGALAGMDVAAASPSGRPKCQPSAVEDVSAGVGGALGGALGRGIGRALGRKAQPQDCEP
ncbi:MAG: hypothetical protein NZM40_05295 [Sphingomonadaceae bacterium]|uniref:hypothetical protein n=1 Tax=Thermaurantiacus sp. TaxID=2820283 RepID=UPI00298EFB61|nr:hypothetical protein [Thermaurantiacus sp.]MCS6986833.1 hypothetical protein [Sphingomonadaceae bacterium]MDW8413904.1 hypothetical protein [Thermaurantiacus sp.]